MCASAAELLAQSEVIVVSNKETEFRDVLTPLPAGKHVIDLVRILSSTSIAGSHYEGICW